MQNFLKKLLIAVILPGVLYPILEGVHLDSSQHWFPLAAFLPFITELVKAWAFIGLGWLFVEHTVSETVGPGCRDAFERQFLGAIKDESAKLRELLAEMISKKGILLAADVVTPEIRASAVEKYIGEAPELRDAKQALLEGRFAAAIHSLEKLEAKKPEHRRELLSALLLSNNPQHWRRAQDLIEKSKDPKDHLRLAYTFWSHGDSARAYRAAQSAWALASGLANAGRMNDLELSRFQNSLAYYYADAEVLEKGEEARKLAAAAVVARETKGGTTAEIGSALATRGYVLITYGTTEEEILRGMRDCADGFGKGAREDLLFRHLARAQKRIQLEQ